MALLLPAALVSQADAMLLMKRLCKNKPLQLIAPVSHMQYKSSLGKQLSTEANNQQQQKQEVPKAQRKSGFFKGLVVGAVTAHVIMEQEKYQKHIKNVPHMLLKLGIEQKNLYLVDAAIALGADLNGREQEGIERTLLEYAITVSSVEVVQRILESKNFIRPAEFNWYTVLGFRPDKEVVCRLIPLLVSHGFDINKSSGTHYTPLMIACRSDQDISVFQAILACSPDVALKDIKGRTIEDYLNDNDKDTVVNVFEYYKPRWLRERRALLEEYKQRKVVKS